VRNATFQDFSVHATGFSQWSVTKLMSAEFIRRKIAGHGHCRAEIFRSGRSPTLQSLAKLEGASPDAPKIFRQCKRTALQKIAVSLFANRYSLLAAVFGSAGASHSRFVHRLKLVTIKRSLLKQAN